MGNGTVSRMSNCLDQVCNSRPNCHYMPRRDSSPPFDPKWLKAYDLRWDRTPFAIVRPNDALEVARSVRCANKYDYKVQARSGGHGFGSYFIGGSRRFGFMIDLMHLRDFELDPTTWQARIGPAVTLGELAQKLHEHGRAIPHGTSRSIGMGGHATVGGIGPMSRMWGTTSDYVTEVEIVTTDTRVHRASDMVNSDLFWAVRGAGSGFGIVTEFIVNTVPEPTCVIEFVYRAVFNHQQYMAPVFRYWQDLIMDPGLDRRFSSFFIAKPLGVVITGTFYGTLEQWEASSISTYLNNIPKENVVRPTTTVNVTDWMGSLDHHVGITSAFLDDKPMHLMTRGMTFREEDKLPPKAIKEIFNFIGDTSEKDPWSETLVWSVVFQSLGGATNDIPHNATAYPHRDKLMMYHTFARGFRLVEPWMEWWVERLHKRFRRGAPNAKMAYAGLIDIDMNRTFAMNTYYGEDKVQQLSAIKQIWDGNDRFFNPQNAYLPIPENWKPTEASIRK